MGTLSPTEEVLVDVKIARARQTTGKYPVEHDDQHGLEHLIVIAGSYETGVLMGELPPREALVKAAATLVAGIEWIDRHTV